MTNSPPTKTIDLVNRNLAKRYRAEKRFKLFGMASIGFGLFCLIFLFSDIISKGTRGFFFHYMPMQITLDAEVLGITDTNDRNQLLAADYPTLVKNAVYERFEASGRSAKKDARNLIAIDATGYRIQDMMLEGDAAALLGQTITLDALVDDKVDFYLKRTDMTNNPGAEYFNERQLEWVNTLSAEGAVEQRFNKAFFTSGDSSQSEEAGVLSAVMGSFYLLIVTLSLSFPIGIAAAVYLEEYAPKNKWTDLIEININNLAAVPSIIFGLLGLAMFLALFGLPRSTPLVGGFVLTLMTLPTIIISSRAAIKAVPPSIREAAYGIGASKMQVTMHHVIPLAMPGMLTGTIIGLAQALGDGHEPV